ncbi:peptidoglycan-recognition protein LC-like isoform X1 [Anopheles funestus]|uniref:peptidoglycan-recognition protein LC-like isoform X1 n=1 Tax=Anopheles funestus TaxID=62324 RepID=UPI0020C667D3|nr:peptidoglycan-recognition protein LC-like isoform X1 [Anopheles funestus]XP_049298981.1 peptidoglycan-recognition protein LC-like isoform X1 [Anopheles funestus]
MALARNQTGENGAPLKTGYVTTQSQPKCGVDTLAAVNGPSTVTGTTDSTRGSLSNISTSSIKRTDNGCDDDSSAFDSSSDTECDDDSIKRAIDRIPGALVPGEARVLPNGNLTVGPEAISPAIRPNPGTSSIGAIAVHNSSDITFGNKTYIKGQVVIKNIYQDRNNGTTNQGYRQHENDTTDTSNSTKKVPSASIPPEPRTWQTSLKTIIKDKPLLSFIVMISLMIVLCAIVAVISILTASGKARLRPPVGDGDDNRPNIPQDKDIEDDLFPDPKPLRLVTRTEWLAQPPRGELTDLKLPVNLVIIAHTATEGCTTQTKCMYQVKLIQEFHFDPDSRNFSDIGYQFLVGGDGNAYEGRGWTKEGAHTKGFNNDSICIAFIGTFIKDPPPIAQLSAAKQLIQLGFQGKYLASNYSLYGHRQLAPFESPGKALYDIIKTWPHWSNHLGGNHWVEPENSTTTQLSTHDPNDVPITPNP